MTGCLPHDSSHQPPQAFYTLASQAQAEGTAAACHPEHRQQPAVGPIPAALPYHAHSQPAAQRPYSGDLVHPQPTGVADSAGPTDVQHEYGPSHYRGSVSVPLSQRQEPAQPTQSETSFRHPGIPGSDHIPHITHAAVAHFSKTSQAQSQPYRSGHPTPVLHLYQQQPVTLTPESVSQRQAVSQAFGTTAVSQYQPPAPHHQYRSSEQRKYRFPAEASIGQPPVPRAEEGGVAWRQSGQLHPGQPSPSVPHTAPSYLTPTLASRQHPGHYSGGVKTMKQTGDQQEHQEQIVTTSACQQPYQTALSVSQSTMLDKKPPLQIVTDHSPASSGGSADSPHFIYPERPTYSPTGHWASTSSGGSPYPSPVKQEAKWELAALSKSSEMTSPMLQVHQERRHMLTRGSEAGELADSETGSSVLEDSSSSSREQSPFSTMAKSLSLNSPEHPSCSVSRKPPPLEMVTAPSPDLEQEAERSDVQSSSLSYESEFHPSKFKRRLHERYMLSLQDTSEIPQRIKEESIDSYERCESETDIDFRQQMPKLERVYSPTSFCRSSSDTDMAHMPKSPSRSSSDPDKGYTESAEIETTSADEGDVFMEPTVHDTAKYKPSSLHQREPLDLSRGHSYPGFRSSSGSSSLLDAEHLSPASKLFSPVFRSPHRLPYSPHGLMSPQSQSPLCSVPEGGRIFNFSVPSPLEGAHSDSDLISPSPVSPRVFTFPPHSSLQNPMSEVNRLALSPRAPYTPPASFMYGKPFTSGRIVPGSKLGDEPNIYSKRSLSESDMTYLCPMCGHVFASNDSLAKHIAKHLPSETVRSGDTKIHYCKVCNRSFSRSDMLTRHLRLHTGLKPYECFDCGQVFSRSDHLNTHRRTHTGEKPYHCPHCPYSACRRDMITRHMRTHTKRTSRRSRYLSVPDEGDASKPSGSVSSTDRTDSQDFSVSGHTCSISSVDSVESESVPSSRRPPYLGTSVDSLLSPEQDRLSVGLHSSPSSCKMSSEAEEGEAGTEGGSSYGHSVQYRKGRNWSMTSVESVESEEGVIKQEHFGDDAFLDPEVQPTRSGRDDRREDGGDKGSTDTLAVNPTDLVGLEAQNLEKCCISSQTPGKSNR